jgi:hypothetical protein
MLDDKTSPLNVNDWSLNLETATPLPIAAAERQ